MQQCPRLLQKFLASIGLKGFRLASLEEAKISLETKQGKGITDIEVKLANLLYLIIEAKVGLNIPKLEQCKKYIKRLKSSTARERRLVMLLGVDESSTLTLYRNKDEDCRRFLTGFHWAELLEVQRSLLSEFSSASAEGRWIRDFFEFLQGEFNMKSYTDEVWIVPVTNRLIIV